MPPPPPIAATTDASEPEPEPPSCGLTLEIIDDAAGTWADIGPTAELIAATAAAIADHAQLRSRWPAEASVVLATDATVRALNRQWRHQDKPTNVLSFPSGVDAASLPAGLPYPLGDIVLAAETVAREAAEQAIPPLHHVQHLVVHGLLHLAGYDHATDAEALAMEALETGILAGLGIPDPHAMGEPALATPAASPPAALNRTSN